MRRHRRLFLEPLENRSLLTVFLTGQPDYYTLDEDTTLNVSAPGVLVNDDATAAVQPSTPAHGSLSFNADGSFSYTPAADYYGTDSFTYQATDGTFNSSDVTVNLTINDVAEPPPPQTVDAVNDSFEMSEDGSLWMNGGVPGATSAGVLANDAGQSVTASLIGYPEHGSAFMYSDGTFSYAPPTNYVGYDTVTYQITDGVNTDTATITINVQPVNDAPVFASYPWLNFSLDEDSSRTVSSAELLTYATDIDGDSLTVLWVNGGTNGQFVANYDNTFTFTPSANAYGPEYFSFAASDGQTYTMGQGTFTVNPVNDIPVASDRSFSIYEDGQLVSYSSYSDSLNSGVTDPDSGSGSTYYYVVSPPAVGQLDWGGSGSFVYTPPANYFGTVSFTFNVYDGSSYSNTAMATISVGEVNDAPDAVEDFFTFDEDALYAPGSLFGNDTDVEGASLTSTLVSGVAHGNLILNSDGTFNYTPEANYSGSDSFTYQISDGAWGTDSATAYITITAINDAPVASPDVYTIDEDQILTMYGGGGVLANDTDAEGNLLTAAQSMGAPHGSFSLFTDGSFIYTPEANFHGTDTITYNVYDSNWAYSNSATITITVNPVNDAPTVNGETDTLDEDGSLSGNLLTNDGDVDVEDELTAAIFDAPAHGTVTIESNGNFTYTPAANYNGPDGFSYTVSDGWSQSMGAVTISLTPVNDAPIAAYDFYNDIDEGSIYENTISVLTNDSDIEGDNLWTSPLDSPAHGTVTVDSYGYFIYTPFADYYGPDVFTYLVSDWGSHAVGTVALMVNAVAAPKLSINDVSATEAEDGELVFAVTLDADANGPFTVDFTTVKLSAEDAPTPHTYPLPDGVGTGTAITQDYFAKNGTLTFTGIKNEVRRIKIPLTHDKMAELTETLQVKLSNIQSGEPATPPNVSFADDVGDGTIIDDDAVVLELDTGSFPPNEGNTGTNTRLKLKVGLLKPAQGPLGISALARADGPITFTYKIEDKTTAVPSIPGMTLNATASVDFLDVTGGTLTLPAYSLESEILFDVIGDVTVEAALESFNVVITSISPGSLPATIAPLLAGGASNIAITDDDTADVIFLQTPPFRVSEAVGRSNYDENIGFWGNAQVTVRLTAPVDIPFTADVLTKTPIAPPPAFNPATSDATINVPAWQVDYKYRLETFSFLGGVYPQQFTFEIPIVDNNISESDEMFEVAIKLALTSPRKVNPGPVLPVELLDDDAADVSIYNKWIFETDAVADTIGKVKYTLSNPSDSVTTFVINDTPGTALAGTDYDSTIYPLTVTIPPMTTSGTFNIPIVNDTIYTGHRKFTLTATGATSPLGTTNKVGISATKGTATMTIREDEWNW